MKKTSKIVKKKDVKKEVSKNSRTKKVNKNPQKSVKQILPKIFKKLPYPFKNAPSALFYNYNFTFQLKKVRTEHF